MSELVIRLHLFMMPIGLAIAGILPRTQRHDSLLCINKLVSRQSFQLIPHQLGLLVIADDLVSLGQLVQARKVSTDAQWGE